MTKNSTFMPISVRGLIRNYRDELVPIEDDIQYAEVFEVHSGGRSVKIGSHEALVEQLVEIFEGDGTFAGAETESDIKHQVRDRFEKGVSDFIVEKMVEASIAKFANRQAVA